MRHRREAEQILELVGHDGWQAFQLVQQQMSVLVLRTQVLLSLSGIVITVTGFSGRAIAQTGFLARASISMGIFVVLSAAATAILGVLRLRWMTQEIQPDIVETITRGLEIRDRKSRYLAVSLTLFVVGFGLYCLAIAQMLLAQPTA